MIICEQSYAICTRTTAFSISLSVLGVVMDRACVLPSTSETTSIHLTSRQVMTGSYHNYFRIYNAEGGGGPAGEITLQADKSAFKKKVIGGVSGRPGAPKTANGKNVMATEVIDFNKKILHGSWHPREPTIAIAGKYLLPMKSRKPSSSPRPHSD